MQSEPHTSGSKHPIDVRQPSDSSMLAAISLLTDQDPRIAKACRMQILEWGGKVRHLLGQVASDGGRDLRKKANAMLCSLDMREWSARVKEYAKTVPRQGEMSWQQLEHGAVLLSSCGRHETIDVSSLSDTLDAYADELRPRFKGRAPMTCARLLAGYLSHQLGYGGGQSSFYDESNVYLDQVVAVRRGVPVTLTLLYILVGRRAGLRITGVAIPDHFLVRVHGARTVLLDPYHEGRHVTKADCIRYLRQAGYSLHMSSYLDDVHDRQILDCLLRNLLRVYGYQEDNEFCKALELARRNLVLG